MSRPFKTRAAVAAVAAGALMVATPAAMSAPVHEVAGDLFGPRGVDVGQDGGLFVTQFDGSLSKVIRSGPNRGDVRQLTRVPGGLAPALSIATKKKMWLLTPEGGEAAPPLRPRQAITRGQPGDGAGYASLYRWKKGTAEPRLIKDIGDYQAGDPDPWDNEANPTETNPFGVAALPDGSALVADAAGNDLLRVWPNGRTITVARIQPRTVESPAFLNRRAPQMATEAVPTSVTVGSDGYYYVGELRGFPGTPKTSQIWRIAPGARNAVCDPERPQRGPCQRFADKFTAIVDLEAGRDGSLYVTELAKKGWLAAESGPVVGRVIRLKHGNRTQLAKNQLRLPGGVAVSRRGAVFATTMTLPMGPGSLLKIH